MFFIESEYLLHEGTAGKTVIEAVDKFLGSRSRDDVLDAELVARHTDQPAAGVQIVLDGLAARAALIEQYMVRCPEDSCRTLTPADRVAASRTDRDTEPCDGPCGQDLAALNDLQIIQTYKLVAQPVL